MHIITKDFKGSPDGYTVIEYKTGEEVELPPSLIDVAESEKWAKVKKTKASTQKDSAQVSVAEVPVVEVATPDASNRVDTKNSAASTDQVASE